eukprot:s2986_g4.t1
MERIAFSDQRIAGKYGTPVATHEYPKSLLGRSSLDTSPAVLKQLKVCEAEGPESSGDLHQRVEELRAVELQISLRSAASKVDFSFPNFSDQNMFKNTYQSGFLSILYSIGSKPLQIWDKKVRNGHIKRLTDSDIQSSVLEIMGTNVSTTYITCPADPSKTLGIKLPFLVMIIKNLKKYFTFEVTVLDDKEVRRRFRASNYQSTTRVKPFICTMPMRLDEGWNQIQFNLSDFTRRAYGTNYIETLRVQLHANCRIRRIYFSDRLYSEEELPPEFKLFLPVAQKAQAQAQAQAAPAQCVLTMKRQCVTEEPSGVQGMEPAASFETPGVEQTQPEKPRGAMGAETESKQGGVDDAAERDQSKASGMKSEGDGAQRDVGRSEVSGGGSGIPSRIEDELGAHVLQHLQQEAARLHNQNEMLVQELQRMKEERDQQARLAVPPSWAGNDRAISSPPRRAPTTHESGPWVSPETFKCTPNGTRIPSGPPPPDPPPFPAWPPELSHYESAEPPRKFRGVMGDRTYRVNGGACTPRSARNFWLEQEVASLREKLESETMRSRSLQGSYWSRPFQTEAERARNDQEAVAYMRRNVGAGVPDLMRDHFDELPLQDRADALHVHGTHHLPVRSGPEQTLADLYLHARSGPEQTHGEPCLQARAGPEQARGDRNLLARSGPEQALGDQRLWDRARSMAARDDVLGEARAGDAAGQGLGEVYQRDRAGFARPMEGALHHGGALRHEREVVEDGDLKSVPIHLPMLPSPDGRDASLEAGDWLIQLEPLIGDLSKNAAGWWRRVMEATMARYATWLHADPLARLRISAPDNGSLSAGFERLDQRVTSLLLQSIPKAIKDEVIAKDTKRCRDGPETVEEEGKQGSRAVCTVARSTAFDSHSGWNCTSDCGWILTSQLPDCYIPDESQLGCAPFIRKCMALL